MQLVFQTSTSSMWGVGDVLVRFSDGQCPSSAQNPSLVCLPLPSWERKPKLGRAPKDGPLKSDCPPLLPPRFLALGCSGTFHSHGDFQSPWKAPGLGALRSLGLVKCCSESGGPLHAPSPALPLSG